MTPPLPLPLPLPDSDAPPADASYRSGVAARLSGVPVETLRVWERRYGVADPHRSAHGQRLYSYDEVRRLGLIKQLVDLGNPIGAIARLPAPQLAAMIDVARGSLTPAPAGALAGPAAGSAPVRVALVGADLVRRLGPGPRVGELDIVRGCASPADAPDQLLGIGADVLLIELAELTDPALVLIDACQRAAGARGVLVLYRFCSATTLRQLRAAGHLPLRAPSDPAEMATLSRLLLQRPAHGPAAPLQLPAAAPADTSGRPAPRRFDDAALETLALSSTSVQCECPRHLVELLRMLTSFERYAAACENRHPADAALHQDLHHSTGHARALLEQALLRVALAEGMVLPDQLPDQLPDPGVA